jgi:hypothetical protein
MNSCWMWLVVAPVAAAVIAPSLAACSGHPSAAHQSSSQTSSSTQDGCRFATAAEIAVASGMPITQSTDNGVMRRKQPGCEYTDIPPSGNARSAVEVNIYGSLWDAQMARIEADPQAVVHDVPGLGQQAKYVTVTNPGQEGGELYVKADSAHGFSIQMSEPYETQQEREVAVAKLILPRIQNG